MYNDLLDMDISGEYLTEADEISTPVKFKWNKEKAEVSYEEPVIVRDEYRENRRHFLVAGEIIHSIEVMFKGNRINILPSLLLSYRSGRPAKDWEKLKGIGYVDISGEEEGHELHWYYHPKIGVVEIKIKREEAMFEWKNRYGVSIPCKGVLIESGILLENGEIVNSGKALQFAREASRLLHDKDYQGYLTLINERATGELNEDEWSLMADTVINERGDTVFWALSYVADKLDGTDDLLNSRI